MKINYHVGLIIWFHVREKSSIIFEIPNAFDFRGSFSQVTYSLFMRPREFGHSWQKNGTPSDFYIDQRYHRSPPFSRESLQASPH